MAKAMMKGVLGGGSKRVSGLQAARPSRIAILKFGGDVVWITRDVLRSSKRIEGE